MTIKTERLLSKAKKLYTKGNFAEAESIYLEVLKLAPNNKDAKNAISALKNKKKHSANSSVRASVRCSVCNKWKHIRSIEDS
jgi:Flp pilus assembly protein TadD